MKLIAIRELPNRIQVGQEFELPDEQARILIITGQARAVDPEPEPAKAKAVAPTKAPTSTSTPAATAPTPSPHAVSPTTLRSPVQPIAPAQEPKPLADAPAETAAARTSKRTLNRRDLAAED